LQRRTVAVAYSAGRDSTALLHATLKVARDEGIEVIALHVHHGLSPQADEWQRHARAQCERWAVEFAACRLEGLPRRGESVEAWARDGRYQALRRMAEDRSISLVLLAHHRLDQAETFLLQALRGAGPAGLAGMPRSVERDGITWARPWLGISRAQIDAYVQHHRLRYVDDESNMDRRFARNRLRGEVWPVLAAAFAQAEATLADSAAWAQEAAACLDELAQLDLATAATSAGLDLTAWTALSAARRSNALRRWLLDTTGRAAPASLVRRLLAELPGRTSGEWPCDGGRLQRHRARLRYQPDVPVGAATPAPLQEALCVRRAGRYALRGWGVRLVVERVKEGGVPMAWLAHLELRPRRGAEQFQAGIGRPPRSLKKQYQSADVPAWNRHGPLLYSGGQLVFVPGLGIDARVIALPGQPQAALRLEPSSGA
jgi:tRNA(Ile)-lysidine synthase